MARVRRYATRGELEQILVGELGDVTHPSSVLDALTERGANVEQLVKVIVDEPLLREDG
jgi:hypothetical protein